MKYVRFNYAGSLITGIREGNKIIEIDRSIINTKNHSPFVESLRIAACGDTQSFRQRIENAETRTFNIKDVDLLAPVTDSGRVICLGGVYASHLRESGTDLNKVPAQWIMPDTAIIGPNDTIILDKRVADATEPAVELGAVIGIGGKNIPETKVYEHLAGFTIVNDVTARTTWPGPRGHKIMDTFSPCGPHIVSFDSIKNPGNLSLSIIQGDEKICTGNTSGQRFTLSYVISFLSSIFPLRPGDVIATGDPGGVEKKLIPGTTLELKIESIGTLRNPIKLDDN